MHILYIVHGFPPRENAGTEQHCKDLASYFVSKGHRVSVIAATREIGKRQHTVYQEDFQNISVWRIVNNIPTRPLSQGESSPQINNLVKNIVDKIKPNIIHIHHIQFLSSSMRFSQPTIYTMHDGWLFCPSGGTQIEYPSKKSCSGASDEKCARCYIEWKPQITHFGQRLIKISEFLHPFLSTQQLHRMWKFVPPKIRRKIAREGHKKRPSKEIQFTTTTRKKHMTEFAQSLNVLISPSEYLAEQAVLHKLPKPRVIRHGFSKQNANHKGGFGFVFLGGTQWHKGIDILCEAYQRAESSNKNFPKIRIYGDDSGSLPNSFHALGRLPHDKILEILQKADALVMASRWPENAPMVIGEARSVGCPIIAPKIGGIPEIVKDGRDGILYTPSDIDELSNALLRIYKGERFSVSPPPVRETQYEKIEKIYEELC